MTRRSARAIVDLPDPDSPTSPRVSPRPMRKLTPQTAGKGPPGEGSVTRRSRTTSRSSPSLLPMRGSRAPDAGGTGAGDRPGAGIAGTRGAGGGGEGGAPDRAGMPPGAGRGIGAKQARSRPVSPEIGSSRGRSSRQRAIARGQRGANAHPGGSRRRLGGRPGIAGSRAPAPLPGAPWTAAATSRRARVYGWAGASKSARTGARSTISPA